MGEFQLADVSAAQLALVGIVAFAASILGGLAGYGTGLVLPVFLAPVVGVANLIPVMAVGMAINNGSRVVAFWRDICMAARAPTSALRPAGVPGRRLRLHACWRERWVALAIGTFLIASVPLRRLLKRAGWQLGARGTSRSPAPASDSSTAA